MIEKVKCFISGKNSSISRAIKGSEIRGSLFDFILLNYPDFNSNEYITLKEYDKVRRDYLVYLINMGNNVVSQEQNEVVESITKNKILSENIEPIIDNSYTLGERAADKIAEFGGSWRFIITFSVIIVIWIVINTVVIIMQKPFDPYPFILLNLFLSCLAAMQAPIIMMSQNRVESRDRLRGENDYKINLKAELEIKLLHEKIDTLTFKHNRELLEIQQIQIELLNEIIIHTKGF